MVCSLAIVCRMYVAWKKGKAEKSRKQEQEGRAVQEADEKKGEQRDEQAGRRKV